MPSLPQNTPTGKRLYQAFRNRQRAQVGLAYPARVRGVVARMQDPSDNGGCVIPDIDDAAVGGGSLHGAEQRSRFHLQARFLPHFPYQGLGVRLARLDPPAW